MTATTENRAAAPAATMTALVLEGPGRLVHAELPVPRAAAGQLLVAVRYVGLCGTDLGFWDGSSNYLHDGDKSYPFVFGHEWSGRVVEVGESVTGFAVGDRVAGHNFRPCGTCESCARGHILYCPGRSEMGVIGAEQGAAAQYLAVPADTVVTLPDSVSERDAALLEPCTAAMHAVDRLRVARGDEVAVLGAGTLGIAAAQIARARGAAVSVYDPNHGARALAGELGITSVGSPDDAPHGRFDAVIEASGAASAVRLAPLLCASGARLAQLGTPHGPVDQVPVSSLVLGNVTLHAVLSGVGHWQDLLAAVGSGAVRLAPLIDTVVPFDEAVRAFERLADRGRPRPKVLIAFS
ncbi:zinc-binding dehydrogenase [Streptomyces sp. NPDC017529]|uniref:zinc-binding dehydrogenase n=1 Tax=Streptomyces sp. NPDC017529 TaxID=3365000 RepID=UPI0037A4F6D3